MAIAIIKEQEELVGRLGYFFCEGCKIETVHRIQNLVCICKECKTKINFLKGEQKIQKNKNINDLLLF